MVFQIVRVSFSEGIELTVADFWILVVVAVAAVGFLVFAVGRVVQAHRLQVTTGREELLGKPAVVKKALVPEGMVLFRGELWDAVSEGESVEVGQQVTIRRVDGLRLFVTKK